MINLIAVGDLHYRGNNPRNRIDNYKEAAKAKLYEIFGLALQHKADAILMTGDIFDSAEVSNSVLMELASILKDSPVKIYTCIGNHDIHGYSTETFYRSSLNVLSQLLRDKFDICNKFPCFKDNDNTRVFITTEHYSAKMDVDGYGYGSDYSPILGEYHIHITHGMLLDHVPPFDKYTLIEDCKTNADLVLCGHYHPGFGIVKRKDGKTFINPGAVMRTKASTGEIERMPQVALISIEGNQAEARLIPLQAAKPGSEVLDRSQVEAENQREYAMSEFAALIQQKTGEKVLLDVNQIVESIAAEEDIPKDVLQKALKKIDEQRSVL